MARQRVYIGTDPSTDPAEPGPLQPVHSPAAPNPRPSFPWSGVYAVRQVDKSMAELGGFLHGALDQFAPRGVSQWNPPN